MTRRNLTAALALSLLFGLLPGDGLAGKRRKPSTPPPPPNAVQGGAFGIYSDLEIAGLALNIEPTPIVALPSTGGNVTDAVVALQLAGVIEVATLGVSSSGTVGPALATVDSFATVEGLHLLDGFVAVDLVVSFSDSVGDGVEAKSESHGSGVVGMRLAGVRIGNIIPPPNTVIPIPGVGVLIVNEQIRAGDGIKTTSLVVNAAHLVLSGELRDPDTVEDCIGLGLIDVDLIKGLLHNCVLDEDVLHELKLLGIVDGGLIDFVLRLLGGMVKVGKLEELLDIDLVDELLLLGKLDVLLDCLGPGGLLHVDLLQALLDDGSLLRVLEHVLHKEGKLDGGFLDISLLKGLIDGGLLSFNLLKDFLDDSDHDHTLLDGELVLASCVSGVQFHAPTAPTGQNFLMHGGGKLGEGDDQAHFGIHVHVPKKKGTNKGLHGSLHFHDHATSLHIHSHTITQATVDVAARCVTFSGIARVNGVDGFAFTATACDLAKHGRGNDTFEIMLEGPGGRHQRDGTLTAGNLHLHLGK